MDGAYELGMMMTGYIISPSSIRIHNQRHIWWLERQYIGEKMIINGKYALMQMMYYLTPFLQHLLQLLSRNLLCKLFSLCHLSLCGQSRDRWYSMSKRDDEGWYQRRYSQEEDCFERDHGEEDWMEEIKIKDAMLEVMQSYGAIIGILLCFIINYLCDFTAFP